MIDMPDLDCSNASGGNDNVENDDVADDAMQLCVELISTSTNHMTGFSPIC